MKSEELRDKIMAAAPNGRVVLPWNDHGEASVTMGDLQSLLNTDAYIQGKIRMVTARGDAISGDEFERERRLNQRV